MNIGIIKDRMCINTAVFEDMFPSQGMETAQEFLVNGAFPDNPDTVAELPDGYGIDDTYIDGEWVKKPAPDPEPVELDAVKKQAITKTKLWVDNELEKGMLYMDGKNYNITKEKQSLLTGQLMIGSMMREQGVPLEQIFLSWNASGEECVDWLFMDLCQLAFAIQQYVKPTIAKQQKSEVEINGAETYEQIQAILQDFM